MTVLRTDLLAYAEEQYAELATLTGVTTGDVLAGHKIPLDNTFLRLGTVFSDLAAGETTDDKAEDAYALIDYFELDRFCKKLLTIKDPKVSPGSVAFDLSKVLTQTEAERLAAMKLVQMLGYEVGGPGWQQGTYDNGYLGRGIGINPLGGRFFGR